MQHAIKLDKEKANDINFFFFDFVVAIHFHALSLSKGLLLGCLTCSLFPQFHAVRRVNMAADVYAQMCASVPVVSSRLIVDVSTHIGNS